MKSLGVFMLFATVCAVGMGVLIYMYRAPPTADAPAADAPAADAPATDGPATDGLEVDSSTMSTTPAANDLAVEPSTISTTPASIAAAAAIGAGDIAASVGAKEDAAAALAAQRQIALRRMRWMR